MKFILLMICSSGLVSSVAQEDAFRQANVYYEDEKYTRAISIYDSLLQEGHENFAVYYNLGNSHLALQEHALAILNYERAARYHTDEAWHDNMAQARAMIEEPIPEFSEFFLLKWWHGLLNAVGTNGYGIMALLCFVLGFIGHYLIWKHSLYTEWMWAARTLLILGGVSLVLAYAAYHSELNRTFAVVLSDSAALYEASDERSQKLRTISPGIKVRVLDSIGNWNKVSLPDKDMGWMQSEWIEMIDNSR